MIIPIGHDQGLRRMPWVTLGIIAVCVLIQAYVSFIATDGDAVLARYGYFADRPLGFELITCAFVHAGWLHLIGNMLFLFLAGSALEDRWGPVPFLGFYLLGAAAGSLAFAALHHGEDRFLVGASGAVAAAMGAFLVCFTHAKIKLAYWFFRSVGTFELAAYTALPLWLAEQLLLAGLDDGGDVAYAAHVGGFAYGAAVALALRVLRPTPPESELEPPLLQLPRDPPPARPSRPAMETDPFRAPPRSPPLVIAPRVEPREAATMAPIIDDPSADAPRLLR